MRRGTVPAALCFLVVYAPWEQGASLSQTLATTRPAARLTLEEDVGVGLEKRNKAGGEKYMEKNGGLPKRGNRGKVSTKKRRRRDTQRQAWEACHDRLVAELAAADQEGGFDVMLLGDSIMESWRGTFMGSTWTDFAEVKQVFEDTLGAQAYRVQVAAIAGDTITKLSWRLRNGEMPEKHPPKVAAVHIGTNDFAGATCTSSSGVVKASEEIEGLLSNMHRLLPGTKIIYVAILPKGSGWPNICSKAILAVNAHLKAYAAKHKDHMTYLDVGQQFLTQKGKDGRQELVPSLMSSDTLHPSFYGMRILAKELLSTIQHLMNDS